MRVPSSGLLLDNPAFPLLQAHISYWGISDAAGSALGISLVCGNLANEPSYDGLALKILSGPSAGQVRTIAVHAGNTLTVGVAFSNPAGAAQQIGVGTLFVILSSMPGGGGPGPAPAEGLSYYGVVDAVPGANQFTIGGLAGLGAGKFNGVNNPYFAFVLRDAGGAMAAPQGEQQPITGYVTATGVFTTTAFTAAVGIGDEILIVSPYLAAMGMLWAEHSGALAYLGQCPAGMVASLNTIVCPNLGFSPNDTFNNSYQMIVIRNANALGATPEMEMRRITDFAGITGTFTVEAFSANVEENDIVLVIHNSVAAQISAFGIADAGSGVGIVRDSARTEADDWWNGQTVMMLSGAARGQKRPISDFLAASDDIIPAPNFDAAVAAGDLYVILAHYNMIVPRLADDGANALTSDVVGRKDDTATPDDMSLLATSSLIRDLKRVLLRMSGAGIFSADIQGVARTELDTMLAQLAIYFNAAGAALAVTMNPGAGARANLQLILQDLGDMLAGATGIVTFPTPRALPANGVSMAEVERYIAELKPHFSTPTALTHTTASAAPAEDTVFTTAAIGPGQLHAIIFPNALVAGDDITFRVYQWDTVSAAYQLLSEQQFVGAQTNKVYTIGGLYIDDIAHIQVRTLRTSATNRSFGTRRSIYQQPVA